MKPFSKPDHSNTSEAISDPFARMTKSELLRQIGSMRSEMDELLKQKEKLSVELDRIRGINRYLVDDQKKIRDRLSDSAAGAWMLAAMAGLLTELQDHVVDMLDETIPRVELLKKLMASIRRLREMALALSNTKAFAFHYEGYTQSIQRDAGWKESEPSRWPLFLFASGALAVGLLAYFAKIPMSDGTGSSQPATE